MDNDSQQVSAQLVGARVAVDMRGRRFSLTLRQAIQLRLQLDRVIAKAQESALAVDITTPAADAASTEGQP